MVTEEFPGLVAAGMDAIGRYGIGFFSVFMLGSVVRVTSRRYDRGEDTALVLEFRDSTAARPILRIAVPMGQAPIDGGTRVEVKLKSDPRGTNGLLHSGRYGKEVITVQQLVASIALNLDVAIEIDEDSNHSHAISPNDWLDLEDAALIARLDLTAQHSAEDKNQSKRSLMRTIKDAHGTVYGRAFISPRTFSYFRLLGSGGGWVTVGGLRAVQLANVRGVLLGEVLTAARNSAVPIISKEVLAEWATEQAKLIVDTGMDEEWKSRCAEVVLECGGNLAELPIASWGGEWLHKVFS